MHTHTKNGVKLPLFSMKNDKIPAVFGITFLQKSGKILFLRENSGFDSPKSR